MKTDTQEQDNLPDQPWDGVKEVMRMAIPIIMGSLSYTVMDFCDRFMVAKLGTPELAAIGSSVLWSFTLSTIILGIVNCVSAFVSQSLGKGEFEKCAVYAWHGMYLAFGSAVIAVVLWPLASPLFNSMGHSPEVTELERLYFQSRLPGYVAMTFGLALIVFFQAIKRPIIPMLVAIFCNFLNILFNYLFIFGIGPFPELGIVGAGIGTVLSQFIQGFILLAVFLGPVTHAKYNTRTSWRFNGKYIRELLRIGLPGGMNYFLEVANWGLFLSFIVGRFGDAPLAATNIAFSFMHLSFMPALAISEALTPIVGKWIGMNDIPRAKARTFTALRIASVYMFCMGIIFAIFGEQLIRLFFSDDPEIILLGQRFLIMAALFQGFDAFTIVCTGALRGAGDTRWMLAVNLLITYPFFLPLAWLIAVTYNGGATGAWIAATVYIIVFSLILFWRFKSEAWRHINIFETAKKTEGVPTADEANSTV